MFLYRSTFKQQAAGRKGSKRAGFPARPLASFPFWDVKTMAEESFYNDVSDGERFLILSDLQQEVPTGALKVVAREMRTTASTGKTYPVIVVEGDSGDRYSIAAWPRDCKACIRQWGGEPLQWGSFELRRGASRYELVPRPMQAIEEQV